MNNNRTWEALSMKDRASFIKLAIQNGYRDLDSIRGLYNNSYAEGGPTKDSARLEYVMRESEGVDGAPYKAGSIRGMSKASKALHSDNIPTDRGKSNNNAYTGVVFTRSWNNPNYNPDVRDEYMLADANELKSVLGYEPVDFVDAYVYNKTPFRQLGVFEDKDSGEKRILRNAVKEGTNPKIYQTYPDTINKKTVRYLDKQLKKGIPNPGDNVRVIKSSKYPGLFNLEGTNLNYDGQKVSVVHVKQPDGKIAYKLVDLYDFDPETWTTPLLLPKAKEGLKYIDENGHPYIMSSPWFYKEEWDKDIEDKYYKTNKFDAGGSTNDYNAILYNGEITVPIEEISIYGNSGLTRYKPGTKDYINQIRKFTDRIYSGDLAIDAVPEYYRKGVQNTLRGDQFANKVRHSMDENYKGLMTAMHTIPFAGMVAASDIVPTAVNFWNTKVPYTTKIAVKGGLEGIGAADLVFNAVPRTIKAVDQINEGQYLKGAGNLAWLGLDALGTVGGVTELLALQKNIKNLKNSSDYYDKLASTYRRYRQFKNTAYKKAIDKMDHTKVRTSYNPYFSKDIEFLQKELPDRTFSINSDGDIIVSGSPISFDDKTLRQKKILPNKQIIEVEHPIKSAGSSQYVLKNGMAIPTSFEKKEIPKLSSSAKDYIQKEKDYVFNSLLEADKNPEINSHIKLFGSTALSLSDDIPHISGDIDLIVDQVGLDYLKQNKNLTLSKVDERGHAQFLYKDRFGKQETLDVNVINDKTLETSDIAIQTYAKQYPVEFRAKASEAAKSQMPISLDINPKDLVENYDPVSETMLDLLLSGKPHHKSRSLLAFEYANPSLVQEALDRKGKLFFGEDYKRLPKLDFSNPEINLEALKEMGYSGIDPKRLSEDPVRMDLVMQEYYQYITGTNRGIRTYDLDALKTWDPINFKGGTASGAGLNSVGFGDSGYGPYYSINQVNFPEEGISTPLDLVTKYKTLNFDKSELANELNAKLLKAARTSTNNTDLQSIIRKIKKEANMDDVPYIEGALYSESAPYRGLLAPPRSSFLFDKKSIEGKMMMGTFDGTNFRGKGDYHMTDLPKDGTRMKFRQIRSKHEMPYIRQQKKAISELHNKILEYGNKAYDAMMDMQDAENYKETLQNALGIGAIGATATGFLGNIAYDIFTREKNKLKKRTDKKALGGPLYNQNNPIESFQGNPYIPVVRY